MPLRRRAPLLVVVALLGAGALAASFRGGETALEAGAADPLSHACPANQVPGNPFADVPPGSAFELAISCLADYGVVRGSASSTYEPDALASRRQVAQSLSALGELAGVEWEASPATFTGSDAAPDAPVARGEAAAFLVRLAERAGAAGFSAAGNAFDDDEELVHEPAIDALAAAGVAAAVTDGDAAGADRSFEPRDPLTREQHAGLLARTLDVLVAQDVAQSLYRDDVAPLSVDLDQAGALVEPGSALTGVVRGDRIATTTVTSPCTGGVVPADDTDLDAPGVQLFVATDPQAPIGRCPVSVDVTFDNGRTVVEPDFVVLPGFTALPELVHVERVSTSTDARHAVSEVRYLFDDPAQLVPATADRIRFTLTTYDVQGSHIATSVRQDGDRAVIATFGTAARPVGEAELRQVSYGTAFQGAVLGAGGRPSPVGTAQLHPRQVSAQAYAGPTWSADLLSVTHLRPDPRRPGASLVDFLFDSPLEAGEPPNERVYAFDVVLRDGTGRRCASLDRLPEQRVTVSCARLPPTSGAVARGVVSAPGFGSDEPLAGSLLTRRPTSAPDVTAVAWGPGADQLSVTFDEPVELVGADRFLVAGPYPPSAGAGQSAEVSPADPRTVVVTLQGTQLDLTTLVTVRGRAVLSAATSRENVFEQVEVAPRRTEELLAGHTLMPDLVGLRIGSDAVARYAYDGVLLPGDADHRPVEDLRLYLPEGTELVCRGATVEPGVAPADGGSALTCRDYGVGSREGPTATADQVRAATYGTAVYDTPPAARVVDGATRPG